MTDRRLKSAEQADDHDDQDAEGLFCNDVAAKPLRRDVVGAWVSRQSWHKPEAVGDCEHEHARKESLFNQKKFAVRCS